VEQRGKRTKKKKTFRPDNQTPSKSATLPTGPSLFLRTTSSFWFWIHKLTGTIRSLYSLSGSRGHFPQFFTFATISSVLGCSYSIIFCYVLFFYVLRSSSYLLFCSVLFCYFLFFSVLPLFFCSLVLRLPFGTTALFRLVLRFFFGPTVILPSSALFRSAFSVLFFILIKLEEDGLDSIRKVRIFDEQTITTNK
jgi:hypothetical protein